MPLTHEQEIALLLGGTVRFPSPAPAHGTLSIIVGGGDPSAPSDPSDLFLKISHGISPKLTIVRVIRLTDVRAAFGEFPTSKANDTSQARFLTASELATLALDFVICHPPENDQPVVWARPAALFVSETAPVLMTVEMGLTAVESAEYHPPLGTRSLSTRPHHQEEVVHNCHPLEAVPKHCHP
ncbi:MAG: hypothetical protein AB7I30_10735 [Isosphaeraceae bacterium]